MWASVVAVAAIGLVAAEPGKPPAVMVPDKHWDPRPGDEAETSGADAPSMMNYFLYREWEKFAIAGDSVGLAKMRASRATIGLPQGVHVLVVKRYRPESYVSGPMSLNSFASSAISSALSGPGEEHRYPLEVRILDGEFKDQVRFVPESSIARLVPAPVVKPPRPRYQPKPADPATHAATTLRSAANLEKAGKVTGALNLYRQVVKQHPGTPEATAAAGRIGAIEGGQQVRSAR